MGYHNLLTDTVNKANILGKEKMGNLEAVCICYIGASDSFIRDKYTVI